MKIPDWPWERTVILQKRREGGPGGGGGEVHSRER